GQISTEELEIDDLEGRRGGRAQGQDARSHVQALRGRAAWAARRRRIIHHLPSGVSPFVPDGGPLGTSQDALAEQRARRRGDAGWDWVALGIEQLAGLALLGELQLEVRLANSLILFLDH